MDLRHAGRIEVGTRGGEDLRNLLDARGGRLQALGQRRELAGHQAVDGTAGQTVVGLRVPLPRLQGFVVPDVRLQLVAQDRGIHLVFAAELADVDLFQIGEQGLAGFQALLLAGGAQVVELAVVTVVTNLGGADRGQLHPRIQCLLRQFRELCIGLGLAGLFGGSGGGSVGGFATLAAGQSGKQGGGEQVLAHR
ncbi:hypothetical protein D3C71_1037960 [compost metagenome]